MALIWHGRQTVSIAGTPEALKPDMACTRVEIQCMPTNTSYIAVGLPPGTRPPELYGNSPEVPGPSAVAGSENVPLHQALEHYTVYTDHTSNVWFDATVAGEGVLFSVHMDPPPPQVFPPGSFPLGGAPNAVA